MSTRPDCIKIVFKPYLIDTIHNKRQAFYTVICLNKFYFAVVVALPSYSLRSLIRCLVSSLLNKFWTSIATGLCRVRSFVREWTQYQHYQEHVRG